MALSNSYRDSRYEMQYPHLNCGFCPSCKGEFIFPKVHRDGLTRVIFVVFNPGAPAVNPNESQDMGPFTLYYATTKNCEYDRFRM